MTTKEIEKLIKVLPINSDSDNLIFVDQYMITAVAAGVIANRLSKKSANFRAIVMMRGNPNEGVKLVSVDALKASGQSVKKEAKK